jgi:hypothetical protein
MFHYYYYYFCLTKHVDIKPSRSYRKGFFNALNRKQAARLPPSQM